MSIMMYMLRHMKHSSICSPKPAQLDFLARTSSSDKKKVSPRLEEFRKKLEEEFPSPIDKPAGREVTPLTKLDQKNLQQPKSFEYPAWPENTNPHTGEVGGPRGPEPTRYGDWEIKGRCSDF